MRVLLVDNDLHEVIVVETNNRQEVGKYVPNSWTR